MTLVSRSLACVVLLSCSLHTWAATINYDWDVTWVRANPDGLAERATIGINGHWPLPSLQWTQGDRIIANVHNSLGNQSTSIHWHGLFQNGSNAMDGPVGVTQCDIAPGWSMVYNFTVDQAGTYWYHSHSRGQYPDGLRQMIVVSKPNDTYAAQADAEMSLSLSDWYHDEMPALLAGFINVENPTGAEPVPDSGLMNDTQNLTIPVEPAKTYLFHMANVAAFSNYNYWIQDHVMTIVEVDGVATEPAQANMIYITPGQRYSFLVTTKNSSGTNFAMTASMDTDLFDTVPTNLNTNVTGWLVYDSTAPKSPATEVEAFDTFDDFGLVPLDGLPLYDKVDQTVLLNMEMINLDNGANYAAFNDVTYVAPVVPTLYTVMSSGAAAGNASIYGSYTNSFVLGAGEIIEIVLNNLDSGKHPFHLHGHNFQAIVRADENAGLYDASKAPAFPKIPARRDTLLVKPQSYMVLRFKADNPGIWLFHCHIDWHVSSGLIATMVEAPLELQASQSIPANHLQVCKKGNSPTAGNAAGDTTNLFDLSKQNKAPGYIPDGFTARGIVALVFSALSALLGMAVISWYGSRPLSAVSVADTKAHSAPSLTKTG